LDAFGNTVGAFTWPSRNIVRVVYPVHEEFGMQVIALCFLTAWLYSLFALAYIPIRVVIMKCNSGDVWTFLSRRRLLFTALANLVAAPFLGLFVLVVSAAGVSGGGVSTGIPDAVETTAWAFSFVFLAAATVALALVFIRPKSGSDKIVP
jgi:hypothetical protein